MWSKSFDKDKNYILRQVQFEAKDEFKKLAIDRVTRNFLQIENPLGIVDDFILELTSAEKINYRFLDEFYTLSSDIYRYINSDNQLEFIWDGKSHHEKFYEDWKKAFLSLIDQLAFHTSFNRLIIKGSILFPDENNEFLKVALTKILFKKYGIKRTTQGIAKKKVA